MLSRLNQAQFSNFVDTLFPLQNCYVLFKCTVPEVLNVRSVRLFKFINTVFTWSRRTDHPLPCGIFSNMGYFDLYLIWNSSDVQPTPSMTCMCPELMLIPLLHEICKLLQGMLNCCQNWSGWFAFCNLCFDSVPYSLNVSYGLYLFSLPYSLCINTLPPVLPRQMARSAKARWERAWLHTIWCLVANQ